jgi:hypothetical protein
MELISPWFQTAELLSAIGHVICDLEAARPARSLSRAEPYVPLTPDLCRVSLAPEGADVGQGCSLNSFVGHAVPASSKGASNASGRHSMPTTPCSGNWQPQQGVSRP